MRYYCELEDYNLRYGKEGDAGLDLPIAEPLELQPGEAKKVKTGVHLELPPGYYGLLDTRSSVGSKMVDLLCRTIDQGYRGNIQLSLVNHSDEVLNFDVGERLAQIIVAPVEKVSLERVNSPEELSKSERGAAGFGSTGTKEFI